MKETLAVYLTPATWGSIITTILCLVVLRSSRVLTLIGGLRFGQDDSSQSLDGIVNTAALSKDTTDNNAAV